MEHKRSMTSLRWNRTRTGRWTWWLRRAVPLIASFDAGHLKNCTFGSAFSGAHRTSAHVRSGRYCATTSSHGTTTWEHAVCTNTSGTILSTSRRILSHQQLVDSLLKIVNLSVKLFLVFVHHLLGQTGEVVGAAAVRRWSGRRRTTWTWTSRI